MARLRREKSPAPSQLDGRFAIASPPPTAANDRTPLVCPVAAARRPRRPALVGEDPPATPTRRDSAEIPKSRRRAQMSPATTTPFPGTAETPLPLCFICPEKRTKLRKIDEQRIETERASGGIGTGVRWERWQQWQEHQHLLVRLLQPSKEAVQGRKVANSGIRSRERKKYG